MSVLSKSGLAIEDPIRTAPARTHRGSRVRALDPPPLPVEGHARGEVPDRRLREELGGAEVRAPVPVELRVETGVVGPRRQVAARERQREVRRTDATCPV